MRHVGIFHASITELLGRAVQYLKVRIEEVENILRLVVFYFYSRGMQNFRNFAFDSLFSTLVSEFRMLLAK